MMPSFNVKLNAAVIIAPLLHSNIGGGATTNGNGLTTKLNEETELHPVALLLIFIQTVCKFGVTF